MCWFLKCADFALISLILFPGLACQRKTYPLSIETKDGVRTVVNPEYPRDGRFIASLAEEMSCGDEGEAPDSLLNKPALFDVDGRGQIYVMDMGDIGIKVYNSRGQFLRVVGRPGQGPGEFGGPLVFLSMMAAGKLCVLDIFQRRVMMMTAEGRYLSGFLVKGDYSGVTVDDKDRIYLSRRESTVDNSKLSSETREIAFLTSIYRVDSPGHEPFLLTELLGESWAMTRGGATIGAVGGAFIIVWNISREGRLYGGYNGEYRLSAFGGDGKKELVFGRRHESITDKGFQGKVGQKKTKPVFRAIVMDETDNLWLELYQDDEAKAYLYDVFSPEGIYHKQVEISARIGKFKNGRIYSLVRSEDGYPSVRRYNMELRPRN